MPNYRRTFLLGGSYFFTANLADRRLELLTENIGLLRAAFRFVRARHPFSIDAAVILPDHLHMIWTLPEDDADFALRWRLIKGAFSRGLPLGERISVSRAGKGERGVWQRRYWEHALGDETDFAPGTSITSTSTRSNTSTQCGCGTGRTRRFAAGCGSGLIPKIGLATPATRRTRSARGDGFRHRLNPSYACLISAQAPAGDDIVHSMTGTTGSRTSHIKTSFVAECAACPCKPSQH